MTMRVVQHNTAKHGRTLQHTQRIAIHCSQSVANKTKKEETQCNLLQRTATRCNTGAASSRRDVLPRRTGTLLISLQRPLDLSSNFLHPTATRCNSLQHPTTQRPLRWSWRHQDLISLRTPSTSQLPQQFYQLLQQHF
jgi:hypothetical protein